MNRSIDNDTSLVLSILSLGIRSQAFPPHLRHHIDAARNELDQGRPQGEQCRALLKIWQEFKRLTSGNEHRDPATCARQAYERFRPPPAPALIDAHVPTADTSTTEWLRWAKDVAFSPLFVDAQAQRLFHRDHGQRSKEAERVASQRVRRIIGQRVTTALMGQNTRSASTLPPPNSDAFLQLAAERLETDPLALLIREKTDLWRVVLARVFAHVIRTTPSAETNDGEEAQRIHLKNWFDALVKMQWDANEITRIVMHEWKDEKRVPLDALARLRRLSPSAVSLSPFKGPLSGRLLALEILRVHGFDHHASKSVFQKNLPPIVPQRTLKQLLGHLNQIERKESPFRFRAANVLYWHMKPDWEFITSFARQVQRSKTAPTLNAFLDRFYAVTPDDLIERLQAYRKKGIHIDVAVDTIAERFPDARQALMKSGLLATAAAPTTADPEENPAEIAQTTVLQQAAPAIMDWANDAASSGEDLLLATDLAPSAWMGCAQPAFALSSALILP